MNKLLLAFLALVSFVSYSQNQWQPGYYETTTGYRTDGLIFNKDWNNNPTDFLFKQNETSPQIQFTIDQVSEFSINGVSKFVRKTVQIERSSSKSTYIQKEKTPFFKEETLFLRVLVEGKNTLYAFNDSGIEKFFYSVEDGPVTQLIEIRYIGPNTVTEMMNSQFRNQLWNAVKCDETQLKDVENLKYTVSSLSSYFVEVNSCENPDGVTFKQVQKKGSLNLKAFAGISMANISFEGRTSVYGFDASGIMPAMGLELEYILPTNNSKWAVILETNYNMFKSEEKVGGNRTVDIKYNSFQVPIGMRHYVFLNENNKLFFSGVFAVNIIMNSEFDYSNSTADIIPDSPHYNFGLGAGYDIGRFSTEIRYYTKLDIVQNVEGSFGKFAAVFKYKIL